MEKNLKSSLKITGALVAALAVSGAPAAAQSKGKTKPVKGPVSYGLTSGGSLVKFKLRGKGKTRVVGKISGLAAGEKVVGIDFRPATRELIGLGSQSNVYAIATSTARATRKSTLTSGGSTVTVFGSGVGIDFNPTVDRLRIVTNEEQNLRVNVDSGATTIDKPLAYAAADGNARRDPGVVAAAYTNNDNDAITAPPATPPAGSTGTQLFDLDTALDSLALQAPPNDGVLNTVGRLGVDARGDAGLDILSRVDSAGRATSNTAYAVLRTRGKGTRLYRISIESGKIKRAELRGGA
jgi:hypothetical protein